MKEVMELVGDQDGPIREGLRGRVVEAGVALLERLVSGRRGRGEGRKGGSLDGLVVVGRLDRALEGTLGPVVWEVGFGGEVVISSIECRGEGLEGSRLRVSALMAVVEGEWVRV